MRSPIAITVLALSVAPAFAGGVILNLNTETGVGALEQVLDIARRNAPTMREADMAVSIYNALQQAKQESAKQEAVQAQGLAEQKRKLEEEVAQLKKDAAAAKPATDEKPKADVVPKAEEEKK